MGLKKVVLVLKWTGAQVMILFHGDFPLRSGNLTKMIYYQDVCVQYICNVS